MISNKIRDEIIELVIETLEATHDIPFPYDEIERRYNISGWTVTQEILKELSQERIIQESGNTFHSGRLLPKGLEIKRNGGWLKLLRRQRQTKSSKDRDEYTVNYHVHGNSSNTNIALGKNIEQSNYTEVSKNVLKGFIKQLKEANVPEEEIEKIKVVIIANDKKETKLGKAMKW